MELIIDTTKNQNISIELLGGGLSISKKDFDASFTQAEKLLPEIDSMMTKNGKNIHDLLQIKVANKGGSFTALRVGIVTANTLAYSLGVPVVSIDGENIEIESITMVNPKYLSEPNVSISKKKII